MQPASSGDGRCRRGQAKTEREGSRFGLSGCAKLLVVRKHRTTFQPAKASPGGSDTAIPPDPQGDWRRRLFKMADHTDR
jgi:hypothetical protein